MSNGVSAWLSHATLCNPGMTSVLGQALCSGRPSPAPCGTLAVTIELSLPKLQLHMVGTGSRPPSPHRDFCPRPPRLPFPHLSSNTWQDRRKSQLGNMCIYTPARGVRHSAAQKSYFTPQHWDGAKLIPRPAAWCSWAERRQQQGVLGVPRGQLEQ